MNPWKDFIGTSAGAIIYDEDGRIFVAQRWSKARDDQGLWEFPGWSIEKYETREGALRRIIDEKYGFEIEIIDLLGVYDVIDDQAGDHWISTTYRARYVRGEPRIREPEKCSGIWWYTLDTIQTMPLSRISEINLSDIEKNAF